MLIGYKDLVTTTIRMNRDDLELLRAIAKKDDRSLNYIINKILVEHITLGSIEPMEFTIE